MIHNNSNKKPPFRHSQWVNTGIVVSIAPEHKDQSVQKTLPKSNVSGSPEERAGDKSEAIAKSDKTH